MAERFFEVSITIYKTVVVLVTDENLNFADEPYEEAAKEMATSGDGIVSQQSDYEIDAVLDVTDVWRDEQGLAKASE